MDRERFGENGLETGGRDLVAEGSAERTGRVGSEENQEAEHNGRGRGQCLALWGRGGCERWTKTGVRRIQRAQLRWEGDNEGFLPFANVDELEGAGADLGLVGEGTARLSGD